MIGIPLAQQVVQTNRLNPQQLDQVIASMHAINETPNPYDFSEFTGTYTIAQVSTLAINTANQAIQQTRNMAAEVSALLA